MRQKIYNVTILNKNTIAILTEGVMGEPDIQIIDINVWHNVIHFSDEESHVFVKVYPGWFGHIIYEYEKIVIGK